MRFAAVLEELEGEKPGLALKALLGMAARVTDLGKNESEEIARFEHMRNLTESIAGRISQMKVSLKDVDSLASQFEDRRRQHSYAGNRFHNLRQRDRAHVAADAGDPRSSSARELRIVRAACRGGSRPGS